jgi:hypothetical protein
MRCKVYQQLWFLGLALCFLLLVFSEPSVTEVQCCGWFPVLPRRSIIGGTWTPCWGKSNRCPLGVDSLLMMKVLAVLYTIFPIIRYFRSHLLGPHPLS